MNLKDTVAIPVARDLVWQSLIDLENQRLCVPSYKELVQESQVELAEKVILRVGPSKAKYVGMVTLSVISAPESCVLSGEGKAGISSFAKGSGTVLQVEVSATETVLHYDTKADVGSKIARLGARLLNNTATKLTRHFFDDFSAVVASQNN